MKAKKLNKKLGLNKNTIADLTLSEMKGVQGGGTLHPRDCGPFDQSITCNTYDPWYNTCAQTVCFWTCTCLSCP